MPRFSYRKVDRNRLTKVYPYVRFPPRYAFEFDTFPGDSTVEAGKITFNNSESETYTYTGVYSSAPSVVITTVDSAGNNGTNVSVTVSAITTTSVTVSASAKFTGQVHVHVAAV